MPITIAHIVALEALDSRFIHLRETPTTLEAIEAAIILSSSGEEALALASTPDTVRSRANALAATRTPTEIVPAITDIAQWLNAAFDTHVAAKSDSGPLASSPDSAGQSS